MPPPNEQEQGFCKRFTSERLRAHSRADRISLAAYRRWSTADSRAGLHRLHAEAQTRDEWRRYRAGCGEAHNIYAPIGLLEQRYSWADGLATHFAQTYRSGHIFNFLLGGVAVCLGLGAFMAPSLKLKRRARAADHARDHSQRDHRQAQRMASPLARLSPACRAAEADAEPEAAWDRRARPAGNRDQPVPKRWIDWYASGIWRAMACPSGAIDRDCAARLGAAIAEHEVEPQVGYHLRNAEQIEALDRRLEQIGMVLFAATVLVTIATVVGLGLGLHFVQRYGNWFTLVSAGFPALGTAVFGIRFQADFGGDALRSKATAETLRQIDRELRKNVSLSRAADLAEQAARIMLSDLDEWRLVNQQRDLSVG